MCVSEQTSALYASGKDVRKIRKCAKLPNCDRSLLYRTEIKNIEQICREKEATLKTGNNVVFRCGCWCVCVCVCFLFAARLLMCVCVNSFAQTLIAVSEITRAKGKIATIFYIFASKTQIMWQKDPPDCNVINRYE